MSEIAEIEYAMSQLLRDLQSEGHIDNQFQQLLMLQDESEPDFVRSVMDLFFQDSQNTLQRIHDMIVAPQADSTLLDQAVHELKGSAASFGAHRITNLCIQLRRAVQERQMDQSDMLVKSIADARHTLNEKLSSYIQLENRKKQLSKGF